MSGAELSGSRRVIVENDFKMKSKSPIEIQSRADREPFEGEQNAKSSRD